MNSLSTADDETMSTINEFLEKQNIHQVNFSMLLRDTPARLPNLDKLRIIDEQSECSSPGSGSIKRIPTLLYTADDS